MWNIISNSINGVKQYVADTKADLATISITNTRQGSTVFIIEDSSTYMLGGNKKWTAVTLPSESNSGSDGSSSDSGSSSGSGSGSSSGGGSSSGSNSDSEYTVVDGGTAAG